MLDNMEASVYRARLSARFLLVKLWSKADEKDPRAFLSASLDKATAELGLAVERVPSILGENQIAGELDRRRMTLRIATKFRATSQRFTLAHEIGHLHLHPGKIYFRDRELSAPGVHREYVEVEADAFAAEFLMPRVFLIRVFGDMFGGPIDGRIANPELASAVGAGLAARLQRTPQELASVTPLQRASAVARAHTYRGRFFASLSEQFNVSPKAMGIQLLQLGLVR
jgi:hypothetical protein